MQLYPKILIRKYQININTLLFPSIKKVLINEMKSSVHLPLIDRSFDKWVELVRKSGLKKAILFWKRSRLHFTRHLAGCPLLEADGVAINRHGLPKWMKLTSTSDLNPSEVRVILTLLTISRNYKLTPTFDESPITSKWEGALPPFGGREFHHALRELGIKKWKWTMEDYHYSTKSGPNGQALATALWDLTCLPDQLKDDLILIGGFYMREAISALQENDNLLVKIWYKVFPFPKAPSQKFRKLSHFADKEGKTRTIAIFDYWSQTILKPLHEHLNGILKKLWNDCTFNQDHFKTCLPSSGPYYSFDLTNATDRMPLLLQKAILSNIVGDAKADAWARILSGWDFSTRDGPVRYNTGQPMGAYSSWPMMALTHHFIVRWAGLKAGKPHFRKYALLGDDIVIADHTVAAKYKEILSALAMPISANKTHVSDDTYEFAKRWIQKGVEVTPLSLAGVHETWSRYSLWASFIDTQQRNGWLNKRNDPELFLSDILDKMRRWRQIPAVLYRYRLFTLVLDLLKSRTEVSADHISHLLALPFPEDYNKVDFIVDLIVKILGAQCEEEENKLLLSKADYHIMIRDGLKKLFPDLQILQSVRHSFAEFNPLSGAVGVLQRRNTDTMMTLKTGTVNERIDCILSKDIVGTSIRKEIFSVRNAKSRIFSQSILVTQLKKEWQMYLKGDNFL